VLVVENIKYTIQIELAQHVPYITVRIVMLICIVSTHSISIVILVMNTIKSIISYDSFV